MVVFDSSLLSSLKVQGVRPYGNVIEHSFSFFRSINLEVIVGIVFNWSQIRLILLESNGLFSLFVVESGIS